MFRENPIVNIRRFAKAFMSNQLARAMPQLYVKLTRQTGRGARRESPDEIVDYFFECFKDYFKALKVNSENIDSYLNGKELLEYGPGDVPGVALLMYAHGAKNVLCVDRFPLISFSEKNVKVMRLLLARLDADKRVRAESCFNERGNPGSGLAMGKIDYLIKSSGLSGLDNQVDLIFSRAVLEHVNDLSATFCDMYNALRPSGVTVHQIDLKSHGLHRCNRLDFLIWPPLLWDLMYSCKGVPNRWRANRYKEIIKKTGFVAELIEATELADKSEIEQVRPHLAKLYRDLPDEELAWLGLWLVIRKSDNTYTTA